VIAPKFGTNALVNEQGPQGAQDAAAEAARW
jgi:hypothetical protein